MLIKNGNELLQCNKWNNLTIGDKIKLHLWKKVLRK